MSRTVIDLDDALLAEARRCLGTDTNDATVNAALLAAVRLGRRREFADAIVSGGFDLLDEDRASPRDAS